MADKFELTDGEPAAPGGKANVKWQSDTNGNISAYVDLAGHIIQDEGTARTQRGALNFVGSAVAATDDAANNRTNVTITGQAQTPWTQNVDAAGFDLTNASTILSKNLKVLSGTGTGPDALIFNYQGQCEYETSIFHLFRTGTPEPSGSESPIPSFNRKSSSNPNPADSASPIPPFRRPPR
jgi:hypothetical protein